MQITTFSHAGQRCLTVSALGAQQSGAEWSRLCVDCREKSFNPVRNGVPTHSSILLAELRKIIRCLTVYVFRHALNNS